MLAVTLVDYRPRTVEPLLLPRVAFARALIRALAQDIACETHPLNNLWVLHHLVRDMQAQRLKCRLDHLPSVMRVFDACMQLDAFGKTQPSACPDATSYDERDDNDAPRLADPRLENSRRGRTDDHSPRRRQRRPVRQPQSA